MLGIRVTDTVIGEDSLKIKCTQNRNLFRIIVEELIAVFSSDDKQLYIPVRPGTHSHRLQYSDEKCELPQDRSNVWHL